MKAIINANVCNTETADVVCDVSAGWKGADADWQETTLYRTKKGSFFIVGEGGPRSIWTQRTGMTSSRGSGLRVLDLDEVRTLMERACCSEQVYHSFGLPLLGG